MDFHDSPEETTFRAEVRDFISGQLPSSFRARAPEWGMFNTSRGANAVPPEDMRTWRKRLAARGWIAPAWPKDLGGAGMGVVEQAIFNEELAYHRVPGPDIISVGYVAPTLMLYGTEEQKRHIPKIIGAEEVWCQGYSEPGSGSDLASLQTRAIRDGDEYVLNGQKIWTSNAHHATWMFMLARTDPDAPKHRGISYLLLDMKTPGITVRPLINMAGRHGFNEVFFEDVRVPVSNRVGEENRGWYVGMATMDFERSAIAASGGLRRSYEDLVRFVREEGPAGGVRMDRNAARHALSDAGIEIEVARMLSLRVLSLQQAGQVPNYEASIAKLFSSELSQRFARLGTRILGLYGGLRRGSPFARLRGDFAESYMQSVPATIGGGTSEIQRNIIATRGLGLPRG